MKKKKLRTRSQGKSAAKKIVRAIKKKVIGENVDGESNKLRELLLHEMRDIYWAEKHLLKALTKMEKAATSAELQRAFADHNRVTQKQVERLERVFELIGEKAKAEKCEAMKGLIDEGDEVKSATDKNSMTRDAGLIIAAQKVEHYEIAAYGSMAQLARTLGLTEVADIFEETLREEKETDELLTRIAESSINVQAVEETEA